MNWKLQAASVVVGLLSVTGCAATSAEDQESLVERDVTTPSTEQEPLLMLTDDPMANASLIEYVEKSQLVLRGTVVSTDQNGPQYPGTPPYTLVTIKPTALLKGEAPDGVKVLMLTQTAAGRPIQVEGRPEFTGHESLWMLTPVDPMFNRPAGEYVLTGNAGLLPGNSQGVIDIDVTETSPAIVDAEKIGTLDQVAEVVTSAQ